MKSKWDKVPHDEITITMDGDEVLIVRRACEGCRRENFTQRISKSEWSAFKTLEECQRRADWTVDSLQECPDWFIKHCRDEERKHGICLDLAPAPWRIPKQYRDEYTSQLSELLFALSQDVEHTLGNGLSISWNYDE